MAKQKKSRQPFPILAMVLAWIIPGAGHVYIGKPVRGIIIFITIAVTFWAGVAVGGVMTVDKRTERWWYIAEMFTGVHGLAGWRLSNQVYRDVDRIVDQNPEFNNDKSSVRTRNVRIAEQQLADLRQQYSDEVLADKGLALVAPAETIARAYAGVAGLLNLLCIFDAVVLSLMGVFGEQPLPGKKAKASPKGKRQ